MQIGLYLHPEKGVRRIVSEDPELCTRFPADCPHRRIVTVFDSRLSRSYEYWYRRILGVSSIQPDFTKAANSTLGPFIDVNTDFVGATRFG